MNQHVASHLISPTNRRRDNQHSKPITHYLSNAHPLSPSLPNSPPLPTHSRVVFLVDFNGLVSLCRQETSSTVIKLDIKDARLTVNGARLHLCLELLEVVAASPVPKVHGPIVRYMGGRRRGGKGRGGEESRGGGEGRGAEEEGSGGGEGRGGEGAEGGRGGEGSNL